MSLNIKDHSISKRIKVIKIQETELDKLIYPFIKNVFSTFYKKHFSDFN